MTPDELTKSPLSEPHKDHERSMLGPIFTIRRRVVRKAAVYNRAMGLFRSRARKNREKAAAELLKEQTRTVKAQSEVARREVAAEARPNPDQPGWGRTISM